MDLTKEQILETLQKHIVSVTFTKVDGAQRVMRCTLIPEYLPVAQGEPIKESTAQTISVWDLDAVGWRSFRIANLKNISIE